MIYTVISCVLCVFTISSLFWNNIFQMELISFCQRAYYFVWSTQFMINALRFVYVVDAIARKRTDDWAKWFHDPFKYTHYITTK